MNKKIKPDWESVLSKAIDRYPQFQLGQLVWHNGKQCRINAFRYEIRPMGEFKIYECTPEEGGDKFDTTEEILNDQNSRKR